MGSGVRRVDVGAVSVVAVRVVPVVIVGIVTMGIVVVVAVAATLGLQGLVKIHVLAVKFVAVR